MDRELLRECLEFVLDRDKLIRFVEESNRIEGINRAPLPIEIHAHEQLLESRVLKVADLETFVGLISAGRLRDRKGANVYVRGSLHTPPPGGSLIRARLELLLLQVNHAGDKEWPGTVGPPQRIHCEYESLHPFSDGNGRSGRAVWAWQMLRLERDPFLRPFLQTFYYDTLEAHDHD